eukprot:TRINITY_DN112435_c0_g1_i1.p1 TRINITY_DN112435_c0_g1~~TRINITY_DN112435_c0_g1_i1.p1  ORF type:complete len:439 (-),score=129.33 TRINITY_DN112435_c0_g1_i1:80-1396(-)
MWSSLIQATSAVVLLCPSAASIGAPATAMADGSSNVLEAFERFVKREASAEDEKVVMEYVLLIVVPLVALFCHAKLFLWLKGIFFFVLSSEKKGMSKAEDTANLVSAIKGADALESKIIIFVRHGESDWNQIFNKSKLLLLPRLILGLFTELTMLPSASNSVFIDSQLSEEGIDQARELRRFVDTCDPGEAEADDLREVLKALRGELPGQSVLVTSNLRRAVSTGLIGFYGRLRRTREKIIGLSQLQEMTRNVDTMALAQKGCLPETSRLKQVLGKEFEASNCLDPRQMGGNKAIGRRAKASMDDFLQWCFNRPESYIIVGGSHSLWVKNFLKVYLPKASKHHGKDQKMKNCAVVAMKLEKGVWKYKPLKTGYRVDPTSITELHLGFEKVPSKKPTKGPGRVSKASGAHGNGRQKENGKHNGSNGAWLSCCTARPNGQ